MSVPNKLFVLSMFLVVVILSTFSAFTYYAGFNNGMVTICSNSDQLAVYNHAINSHQCYTQEQIDFYQSQFENKIMFNETEVLI